MKARYLVRPAEIGLFGTPALASDLPINAPGYKATIATPSYNWNGFYAAVNFGGGWSNGSLNIPGNGSTGGLNEFIGGVQGGYNFQTGHLLLGVDQHGGRLVRDLDTRHGQLAGGIGSEMDGAGRRGLWSRVQNGRPAGESADRSLLKRDTSNWRIRPAIANDARASVPGKVAMGLVRGCPHAFDSG
ncbi:MAG TPA: hypothetical protein VFB02_23285 [Bradyrhizobium sp.]|nr:hypothetical protein [Bradyrhizobium sp.]